MKLSILICSLVSRSSNVHRIIDSINNQIKELSAEIDVEILLLMDNKKMPTGSKRNHLLGIAKGKYICFVDDDDEIYPAYVRLILQAIEANTDCIATQGHYSINGAGKQLWKLSKDFIDQDKAEGNEIVLFRRANHLSPVKRELALQARFPDISNAEDKEYSRRLNPLLKTETAITEPIYHYAYSSFNKEY